MLLWVLAVLSVLQWADVNSEPQPISVCEDSPSKSFSGYLRNASESANISVTQVVQHTQAIAGDDSPKPTADRFGTEEERAYQALLAATGKEDTIANNESFTEALDEIKQAVYAACFIEGITERDLSRLVQDLETAYRDRNVHDLRKAYGSILCLKSKASRRRRTSVDDVYNSITENQVDSLFFTGTFSVGFAIDDTGSMADEIEQVKCLVRAFVKSTRTGADQYILGTFSDPEAIGTPVTQFLDPEKYDSNNAADVQRLLGDLDSIRIVSGAGGDTPEYGMHGISRVIDASTISEPNPFNRVLLFTDAPPKDYSIEDTVKAKLLPTGRTILHAFLPASYLQPCDPTWSDHTCKTTTVNAYADLVKDSNGILVDSLTDGGFSDFIEQYNVNYGESLEPVSCRSRKKRAAGLGSGTECSVNKSVVVSEFARQLQLVFVPQGGSVNVSVSQPLTPSRHIDSFFTSVPILQKWDNPLPGNWEVCGNGPFELDVKIENYFPFSVEFFSATSDTPYLLTLPSPGCPVSVTMFSPAINKLSTGEHKLEIVSTTGIVISQIPIIHLGCSTAYIRGSTNINLPHQAFTVRFTGVSRDGYHFETKLARQYRAPYPPLQLHTTSTPTRITRGTTATYSFHLNITKTYPGCHIRLPISIEAQTDIEGITLPAVKGGTLTSSYTFSIRVTVSSDAPVRSGEMVLRIYDSRREIVLQSTSRIEIMGPSCPCQNGGSCSTFTFFGIAITRCNCPHQYIGSHCETRRPEKVRR